MIIAPKLDTHNKLIQPYIPEIWEGAVELQMLTADFQQELVNIKDIVGALPAVRTLIIHLPFGSHELALYCMSQTMCNRLCKFLCGLDFLQDVRIVMHCEAPWSLMRQSNWEGVLTNIYRFSGSHITFLIENAMTSPNRAVLSYPDAAEFLKHADKPFIKGLVDLTHIRATMNLMGIQQEYPSSAANRVTTFHIASARNYDGWMDKKTHGRCHFTYSKLQTDLDFLFSKFPLNADTICVAEVSEEDYVGRPDMLLEIQWMQRYREEVLS